MTLGRGALEVVRKFSPATSILVTRHPPGSVLFVTAVCSTFTRTACRARCLRMLGKAVAKRS